MMSVATQSFIRVDLHKCRVTLAAADPLGERIAVLKISTKSVGKIEEWLSALPQPVHLAVEACTFVTSDGPICYLKNRGENITRRQLVML